MKTLLIAFTSLFFFAFSCNEDKKENQKGLEAEVSKSMEEAGINAKDFKEKIDELLTLEIASQVSGLPANEAKKDHSKFSSVESVKYKWKSTRTRKYEVSKGNFMNLPLDNVIELSWVKNTTLEQFKHDYHNPTAEEIKNAEAAMKTKSNELNADGIATKEQTNSATEIANSSISKFKVEEVPNLGEYSVFVNSEIMGASVRDLKVFYKGLSFTLNVNVSDDKADNDKKAIEASKLIIANKLK